MGSAIPYHAQKLYQTSKIGYGIISLQAKESKHTGLKEGLGVTNGSKECSKIGKWWQVMRFNYIKTFYLLEHQPMLPSYTSHFKTRTPPHCENDNICDFGREKETEDDLFCSLCSDSTIVVSCAQDKSLSSEATEILKPVLCDVCKARFADNYRLDQHKTVH